MSLVTPLDYMFLPPLSIGASTTTTKHCTMATGKDGVAWERGGLMLRLLLYSKPQFIRKIWQTYNRADIRTGYQ